MSLLKPQNRIEDYLYIILKKLNGEDISLNSLYLPKCRIEDYLYKIALNINSSQGGENPSVPVNAITDIEVRKVEEGDTPSLTFTRENNKYLVDIVFPTSGTNFSGNAIDVFYKDTHNIGANDVQKAIDTLKKYIDYEINNVQIVGGAMDYKYIDNAIKKVIDGASEEFNTLGEIANILENNPNIINDLRQQMVNILEDSQKYTDEQIATLNNIDIEIVAVLPQVGKEDTLYFVVNATGDSFLDLYLWDNINHDFDLVGSSTINLDGYAKLEDLPTKTSQLTNDSNFAVIYDNKKSTDKTYSSNKIEELINAISNDILPRLSISNNRLYFDGQLIHLQGDTVAQADKVTGWQQTKPNSYLGLDKDGVYGWHTLPLQEPPVESEYGGDKVNQLFLNKVATNEVTEIPTVNPYNIVQCYSAFGTVVQGEKTLFKFDESSDITGDAENSHNNIIVRGSSIENTFEFANDLGILSDDGESIFYATNMISDTSNILDAEIINGTLGAVINNKSCFNDRFQIKDIQTNAVVTSTLTEMNIPTVIANYTHRINYTEGSGLNIILDADTNINEILVYVDTRYICDPFIVSHIGLDGTTKVLGVFNGNPASGYHSVKFKTVKQGRITITKKGDVNYAYFNRVLVLGNDSSTEVLVVNEDNNIIDTSSSNNVIDIQGKITIDLFNQYKTTINKELFKTLPNNIKLVTYSYKTGELLTPLMTADTTVYNGRKYVVTASSNYGVSYAPYKAFDREKSNVYNSHLGYGHQSPSWLQIDLGQPELLGKYTYQGRNYSDPCMATYWEILGSNDNNTWELVHDAPSGSGNNIMGYVYKSPDLNPIKAYRYYRLSTMDTSMYYGLGIQEWELFGKPGYQAMPSSIYLKVVKPSQTQNTAEIIQEADLTSIANILFMNTMIYGDLDATKFQLSFDDKSTWKETNDNGMSWVDATIGTPIIELATINKAILDMNIQQDKKLFIKVIVKNPTEDTILDAITCRYQEERPYRQMADSTYYLDIYKSKIKITWRGNYEFVKIHFI